MSHKFTPGPWHISQKSGLIIYDKNGCDVCNAKTYHGRHKDNEAQSNACLIAAAPDLYKVCQTLLEAVPYVSEYDVPFGLWDDLRDALAKAQGDAK